VSTPAADGGSEATAALLKALTCKLAALEEGPARAGAAARALAEMPAGEAVGVVAALARSSRAEARISMAAVGQALVGPDAALIYEHLAEVYAVATERDLLEVSSLLISPPARKAWVPPRDQGDSRLATLTLGHKKTMARSHRDPDLLARLAAEGEPSVVRELLRNPLLTEPFAVRIAARRPMRPETLRLLAESRRWRTRPAVMLALVRNPYAEPALALKLVAVLPAAELAEVGRDATVHPLLRATAARLARAKAGTRGR
jgi:hypothetical protein